MKSILKLYVVSNIFMFITIEGIESRISQAIKAKYGVKVNIINPVESENLINEWIINNNNNELKIENNTILNNSINNQQIKKEIIINSKIAPFEKYGAIGWQIFKKGSWQPAQNESISTGNRIAIHIHGSDGSLSKNIGNYLSNKGIYDYIIGFRYDVTKKIEESGNFFAANLLKLLENTENSTSIDIFAYSLGSMVTRWCMEVNELGQYKNINRVVLIAPANTGFYCENSINKSTQSESQIAAQLALDIYYKVINNMLIGFSDQVPNQELKAGSSFTTSDHNISVFLRRLNSRQVSEDIYKNLKYYILAGTEGQSLIPFDILELMTGINNIFKYSANSLKLNIDYEQYRKKYKTLGSLWHKAFIEPAEIVLNKKLEFDGFIAINSAANLEVPASKSLFFKNNSSFAMKKLSLNHAQLAGIGSMSDSLPTQVITTLNQWLDS